MPRLLATLNFTVGLAGSIVAPPYGYAPGSCAVAAIGNDIGGRYGWQG